ncbi:disulfide oxidoreductase [Halalkalibacillus sediminis]|uniref:Disulfide oxidoreductase n=1 Tax=Halalkalibacillus sediminis TaxID=2018042 RepID=A0A2I0QUV3_9BACI|nr:YuzD family protein [Halalkalibacillus sediminis]PKR78106.1 disulfide oxidoreductase [Halalkalibacillus sediminis]
MKNEVELVVYGAEVLCPSCVNLPSSKEQYEWLQAAISRKYGTEGINYKYIDIYNPPEEKPYEEFAERVIEEDMFYPVVLVEDEIVGEGNPRLKTVYKALEERGFEPQSS